jgi:NAD(P)H-hydrate epimerase
VRPAESFSVRAPGHSKKASRQSTTIAFADPIENAPQAMHRLDSNVTEVALHAAASTRHVEARAQAGLPAHALMRRAGEATARLALALAPHARRVWIAAGPGNNGGDGLVAARKLARIGAQVVLVLVAAENRPRGRDAARNWDRVVREKGVTIVHAPVARDVAMLAQGIDRASVVVDALLGTGVRGELREPIRGAVELIRQARAAMVPILAVDTPTAVDASSGQPSDPAVRADLTITFHRPKTGLLTKSGAALAGRILVAPIGIPQEADRG